MFIKSSKHRDSTPLNFMGWCLHTVWRFPQPINTGCSGGLGLSLSIETSSSTSLQCLWFVIFQQFQYSIKRGCRGVLIVALRAMSYPLSFPPLQLGYRGALQHGHSSTSLCTGDLRCSLLALPQNLSHLVPSGERPIP